MGSQTAWPTFASTDSDLDIIIKLSRYYGSNGDYVLAGGGNTSVKIGDRLFVKGSGCALADIDADGFVELDRSALEQILASDLGEDPAVREIRYKEAVLAARCCPDKGQRPSVESVLHNMMPNKFVVHVHPTLVNVYTCCETGQKICDELFGDRVLWIPYTEPGPILAQTLYAAMRDYTKRTGRQCPDGVFIGNHGYIVCGDTAEEVRERFDKVMAKLRERLDQTPSAEPFGPIKRLDADKVRKLVNVIGPALRALLAEGETLRLVNFDDTDMVMQLVGGAEGKSAALAGPLTPDHIVYCKPLPLWFQAAGDEEPKALVERLRKDINAYQQQYGFLPNVVLVEGAGMFASAEDLTGSERARLLYRNAIEVSAGAKRLGKIRPMSFQEWNFIEHGEVEAYRRAISAGARRQGRAVGKVAVVTGAAQGFGFEIAEDLVRQGACVVLTDINAEGVAAAAEKINAAAKRPQAVGLAMNVTDGASIAGAFHQTIRRFGGFDLLVSNAGVLKAGSVKDQPEKDFDFVTAVNYKGYFLCVQHAAPILAVQHLARPSLWSDIIQINSKSGLVGSNRNGAYAGSKFGGIGLTQSFALELVEDGVKVNSICPGNFFDGPLWSDPNNGLFVQYLRTGKVPGAKTIADVRKAYETKVPMGRGCTTPDVMKAIYYLMDQKYETGQAVPVTGGQVMLS